MKRALWIGIGVLGTIVVLRQVAKASERFGPMAKFTSPAGIAESIGSLAVAAKDAGEQLRASIAENEAALTAALLPDEEEISRARHARAERRNRAAQDPFGADFGEDLDPSLEDPFAAPDPFDPGDSDPDDHWPPPGR